jgi:hypothetical protein
MKQIAESKTFARCVPGDPSSVCTPPRIGMTVSVIAKGHFVSLREDSRNGAPRSAGCIGEWSRGKELRTRSRCSVIEGQGIEVESAVKINPPRFSSGCDRRMKNVSAAAGIRTFFSCCSSAVMRAVSPRKSAPRRRGREPTLSKLLTTGPEKRAEPRAGSCARPLEARAGRSKQKGQQSFLCCPRGLYPPPGTSPNSHNSIAFA